MSIIHFLIQDQKYRFHRLIGYHGLNVVNRRPCGGLEVLFAEHVPAELVVVCNLEYFRILYGAIEVSYETLDCVVHLVALLLTFKFKIDYDAWLAQRDLTFLTIELITTTAIWVLN